MEDTAEYDPDQFESICIYQKQFDDVEESFRIKIYFKAEKEPIESTGFWKMKNFEEGK